MNIIEKIDRFLLEEENPSSADNAKKDRIKQLQLRIEVIGKHLKTASSKWAAIKSPSERQARDRIKKQLEDAKAELAKLRE